MSASTHLKKAAADDPKQKLLSNNDIYSMLNLLRAKAMSLKLAGNSNSAEMQSLCMAISSPPPASSPYTPLQRHMTFAYNQFMQEPYRATDCFAALKSDGLSFAEWLTCLNRALCVAFNSETSIDDSPSSLNDCLPEENRAICHFINASIPHKFALCIGINPSPLEQLQGPPLTRSKPAAALEIVLKNCVLFVRCSLCWSKTAPAPCGQTMCWFFHYTAHLQYLRNLGWEPMSSRVCMSRTCHTQPIGHSRYSGKR
ncbi:hypothetical protein O181_034437 [Austropuccinia psidii MF-1]|uniref:Uncharacterized protein n=1 Tax=Austropuccinia psidii MF-1 TaxID=1389203 RepID=A0A9Q3D389_9BASI|nr:hypothetical protein [Austropuccinia psidii MF-1]